MNEKSRIDNLSAAWRWLFLAIVAYLAIFFFYYPPSLGIEDEAVYVNQTFVWLNGGISAESVGYEKLAVFEDYLERNVSWGSPGRSIAILPFWLIGGASWIFVSGAFIHVLTVLLAALLLQKLKRSPLWALLILFHPTLALYSRTVMSDELAGFLLLLSIYFATFRAGNGFLSGVSIGCAVFTRPYAAVIAPFFALALWRKNGFGSMLSFLVTTGVFAVGVVSYNFYIFGNFTGRPVYGGLFGLQYALGNAAFYVPALLLIYPLMLFAPFVEESPVANFTKAVCLPTLALLLLYFFHETGANFAQTLVIGQRLLQTALPVWIVSFALSFEVIIRNLPIPRFSANVVRIAVIAVSMILFAGDVLIFRQHQAHLLEFENSKNEIVKNVPENSFLIANRNLTKIIGTPAMNPTKYRWRNYNNYSNEAFDYSNEIANEKGTWYLAILPKNAGDELPEVLRRYVERYKMRRVETSEPNLILYRAVP